MSTPSDAPESKFDLAGGENPSFKEGRTVSEVLQEARSRRTHRFAAAALIYIVVAVLLVAVSNVIRAINLDLPKLQPAAIGLVASLVVAISVLTIALAKFAYGLSSSNERKGKAKEDESTVAPPVIEAVKTAGDLLAKAGEFLKGAKP
ncbi:hypothetical protein [Acidovorax sp. LjRoot117]|uniref:hypothetical protein n=1 Tax=Acidovorax sp. LjRoot117 TaxID=3342255 RepID=UPI003ED09003